MDIVERLRDAANQKFTQDGQVFQLAVCSEAADYIKQLEKGNRLHLKLAEIKDAEIKHLQHELNELRLSYDVVLQAFKDK